MLSHVAKRTVATFALFGILLNSGLPAEAILDPDIAHDARLDQRLDVTWAEYMIKMSWSVILEDYELLGDRIQPGEPNHDWYVSRGHELMEEVGECYMKELKKLKLSAPVNHSGFPEQPELTSLTYFDLYSYCQLRVASRYIDCGKQRFRITERVGRRSFEMMRAYFNLEPSGDPYDLPQMIYYLNKILSKFQEVGFYTGFDLKFEHNELKAWNTHDRVEFDLWMKEPATFVGEGRLHREEGFASMFVARTIESLFAAYMADAKEIRFDPNEHAAEKVHQKWVVKAI